MDLEKALGEFKKKKILVVGDVMLDKFTLGEIDSINPEMPAAHKIKIKPGGKNLPGGAANVANNITSLGAECFLIGAIGKDKDGKILKKLCEKKRINFIPEYLNQPTIVKERIGGYGQQLVRLDYGEYLTKIEKSSQQKIFEKVKSLIEKLDFIIFSDYDKHLFNKDDISFTQEIIQLTKKYNVPTLADPKPKNILNFKGCTLISPNQKEAEKITGIEYSNGKSRLEKMSEALSQKIGSDYVIITCGEDGAFSYDFKKQESRMIKTIANKTSNVTGAGDTFAATLVLGLCSGLKIHEASKIANYAAGIVVEKPGTATTSIKEIKEKIYKGR